MTQTQSLQDNRKGVEGPVTPLPWRVRTVDESSGSIETQDFIPVAQVALNQAHMAAGVVERHACRQRDAQFIVTACNHHEELVEALRSTRARLLTAVSVIRASTKVWMGEDAANKQIAEIDELLAKLGDAS